MFGLFSRRRELALDVPEADFFLREPRKDDYQSWRDVRVRNYAHLQPFEPTWSDDTLEETAFRNMVRNVRFASDRKQAYSFFLISCSDQAVMGAINITNIRRRVSQMATIGYWIGSEYGRAGRMKKAVARIVRFGFEDLTLHRIEAACIPENAASAAILLGCGFEEEGYAKAYLKIDGEWYDHRLFGIVRPAHLSQV